MNKFEQVSNDDHQMSPEGSQGWGCGVPGLVSRWGRDQGGHVLWGPIHQIVSIILRRDVNYNEKRKKEWL